ncbi:MSHA biogenesis protein MshI [Paraglaciecola sp. 25GB23A]|uniref:MSHA biogenesis protein MshI n=1 Tax=Paraglaciecola sp. 25GB23A TaxID=3156068 RepID=UPI0032AE92DC
MQIGWREYIKRRFTKASSYHSVGIEYGINELHIATLQRLNGELTWVKQHKIIGADWAAQLSIYVKQQHLENTQCYVSLSLAKYQLLQLDKPQVLASEITQALQWTVKEQLATDEELAIDYFDLPAAPANAKKLNVVALGKQELRLLRDAVLGAGLQLAGITIEELSNCNLLEANDQAAIVLYQNVGEQISLNIVKNGLLYFSRRLRGYENLASFSAQELQLGIADNLALEIQRSMDYFESQLRQAPIKQVYLSLDTLYQAELTELIKALIFINVSDLKPSIKHKEDLIFSTQVYASIGAAMENVSEIAR